MNGNYYSETFKKVGKYLIIVGIIDIILFSITIINIIHGRIKFYGIPLYNIYALFAGIFLYFTRSKALAEIIAFFSILWWSALIVFPFYIIIFFPVEFLVIFITNNPLSAFSIIFEYLFSLCFLLWIYMKLTGTKVENTKKRVFDLRKLIPDPSSGLIAGFLISTFSFMIILMVMNNNLFNINAKSAAIEKAQNQMGNKYKYIMVSTVKNINGTSFKAKLIAYNEEEIKMINVNLNREEIIKYF